MYPFLRLAWQWFKHRDDAPLALDGEHVSEHLCLPWDLDPWVELNNGRTLTLYDLGRVPMMRRIGLVGTFRARGWSMTVAGSTTRYRRRIRNFDRITMRTRVIGWDRRFFYIEQSMWRRDGECASHVLLRKAIVGKGGIVAPAEVVEAVGHPTPETPPPDWAKAWIAFEDGRPWPPMQD
ncbi:hypothetical protein OG2516_10716 [Oceanicola granulosus HTCC2516]|uniref:Thioeseterase n=1 Tax=Oceanicola granulosus (strain ATCC BAA-861 / DSM 15982 / KCTC 12143 / HTCC2516) TaxID=314256 RepID=Q2CK60_OCEGH|nr:acyl-CoA thioesterase [Oceanicola granulosus]EAR52929.1 hypothetical protein OG2516_10716 [Oceanicola granulosus HTCC2516]